MATKLRKTHIPKHFRVVEAPEKVREYNNCTNVFLAGSISNAVDWQKEAIRTFMLYDDYLDAYPKSNIQIINPRRYNYDKLMPGLEEEQITWEYQAFKMCRHVIFWFSNETLAPITLFEYGKCLVGNKRLYVGCHPSYQRRADVVIQTRLENPSIVVQSSIYPLISNVIKDIIE